MFDTLKYSKALEAVGVSRDQAEAHIRIITEIVEGDLATKQDVTDLRQEMKQEFADVRQEFATFRQEMVLLEHRLTIKLGAMMATMIAIMTAVIKLT